MNETDPAQLVPYVTGGITALGCTVGQAITGISTLALGPFVTFAAIVAGAALTMKYQYWRVGG